MINKNTFFEENESYIFWKEIKQDKDVLFILC